VRVFLERVLLTAARLRAGFRRTARFFLFFAIGLPFGVISIPVAPQWQQKTTANCAVDPVFATPAQDNVRAY
jgi:hypothetical protein